VDSQQWKQRAESRRTNSYLWDNVF
jgi:hypothetical protein